MKEGLRPLQSLYHLFSLRIYLLALGKVALLRLMITRLAALPKEQLPSQQGNFPPPLRSLP
jgi:hypothetical protein